MKGQYRYILILICLLVIVSCKITRNNNSTSINNNTKLIDETPVDNIDRTLVFPDDWLGYWEGDLHIYNETGLVQTLPMALDNAITEVEGRYTWAIIYGPDSIAGRRDYFLDEIDISKGHYKVDEKNGIFLDAYLFDNELVSVFEVMGNSLTSTYKREGDSLLFDIMMYKSKHSSITGDTIMETDTIPPVKNFKPVVRQKAVLKKRN